MFKVVQMSDGEMMNGSVSFELQWGHLCPCFKSQKDKKICIVGNVETIPLGKIIHCFGIHNIE